MKETLLDQGIAHLRTRLLVMGASVGIAIDEACSALERGDTERAHAVVDGDDAIDAMENAVDELCLSIMVRNQPFAQDLRFVVASLRIVIDIERMGDEASSLAERAIIIGEKLPPQILNACKPLMNMARQLYKQAIEVFQSENAESALQLLKIDDEITQLEVHALHDLMDCFSSDGCSGPNWHVMHGILITRSLSRICRRASNIAEQTYFIAQGISLKHKPLS